jgi:hypothetical protein
MSLGLSRDFRNSLEPRKACTYTGKNNTEKRGHTSMPQVRFEPIILVTAHPLYTISVDIQKIRMLQYPTTDKLGTEVKCIEERGVIART